MMEEDNNSMINNQIDQGPQIEIAEEKRKIKKGPIIIAVVLIILGLLGYFVIYPYVKDNFIETPVKVFENSLNYLNNKINSTIDEYDILSTPFHELNLKLTTNIPELQSFENYTYGLKTGLDQQNKKLEGKLYIQDSHNKEYSATGYVIDKKTYYALSTDERLFKGPDISEFDIFEELTKTSEKINKDDIKYIINKTIIAIKNNLNKDNFSKTKATISINGKNKNVDKNSYKMTISDYVSIIKGVFNALYEDNKIIEILEKQGTSKEEFKKIIDLYNSNMDNFENDNKEIFLINIYTNNMTFSGIDLETDNKKPIYFYVNNKEFEIGFQESDEDKTIITGVQNGDKKDITVKSHDEVIATFVVSKWSKEEISLDYNIKMPSYNTTYNYGTNKQVRNDTKNTNDISGKLEIKTPNKDSNNKTIILSIKYDSSNITLTMNYKEDKTGKVADISESFARELDDDELETVFENFLNALKETPLKSIIDAATTVSYPTYSGVDY